MISWVLEKITRVRYILKQILETIEGKLCWGECWWKGLALWLTVVGKRGPLAMSNTDVLQITANEDYSCTTKPTLCPKCVCSAFLFLRCPFFSPPFFFFFVFNWELVLMFIELSGNLSIKLNALGQIHNQQSLKQPTIVLSHTSALS